MELHRPLQDRELSRLAEQMSPIEFEQIARVDLGLTKVRLDQCREDAGRNSIVYMANSLTMWRDMQPQNEARLLLHSALTKSADRGLIVRTSFKFLITGEEDNDNVDRRPESKWRVFLKKMQIARESCRSAPTAVLALLGVAAIICAVFQIDDASSWMRVPMDKMASEIIGTDFDFSDNNSSFGFPFAITWSNMVSTLVTIIFFISLGFECCLCFNVAFVRGQRAQEGKRDKFRFTMFFLMASVYLTSAAMCFYSYHYIQTYQAPAESVDLSLQRVDVETWDKIQVWFGCCGIYNYTYWLDRKNPFYKVHKVPNSCCKIYKPNCGDLSNLDLINKNGCLHPLQRYLSDQLRHQRINNQQFYLVSGFVMLILSILIIHFARKAYHGDFKCCKVRYDDDVTVVVNVPNINGAANGVNYEDPEGAVAGVGGGGGVGGGDGVDGGGGMNGGGGVGAGGVVGDDVGGGGGVGADVGEGGTVGGMDGALMGGGDHIVHVDVEDNDRELLIQ